MLTDKHKKFKCSTLGLKFKKSQYAITKNDVYKHITEHRKTGRKVSIYFFGITAHKRMKVLQLDKLTGFKGSVGWFLRFIKRKNINFARGKVEKA